MASNIYEWDVVAANNTSIDAISQAENVMKAPAVNNTTRSIAAILARFVDDLGGVNTVAGTGDAITVTLASGITAYASGQMFMFKAGAANTGATTIDVNAIGAKAIRQIEGGTDIALGAGALQVGGRYTVVYDTAANAAAGAWVIVDGVTPGWKLISKTTLSAVASWTATGLSGYRLLRISAFLAPAVDGARIVLAVSTDNGSSYSTTGYSIQNSTILGAVATHGLDNAAGGFYVTGLVGNAAQEHGQVTFDLGEFNQALYCHCSMRGYVINASGVLSHETSDGIWATATARNAVRLTMSGGNIASGYVVLEGMAG